MSRMFITNPPVRLWVDFNLVELWGIVQADIWARFLRLVGHQVIHMGLVESQAAWIEPKSRELGMSSRELIEGLFALRQEDFARFEIGFDGLFTTDSLKHQGLCQSLVDVARESGSVYVKEVEKFSCLKCHQFPGTWGISGNCPNCGAPAYYAYPQLVCSKCHIQVKATELAEPSHSGCGGKLVLGPYRQYCFRPGDFSPSLKEWASEPSHFSRETRNFILGWIEKGLSDIEVSRNSPFFGFSISGERDVYFHEKLVSLLAYLAGMEKLCSGRWDLRGNDHSRGGKDRAEVHHFASVYQAFDHAVLWPAMLMATGRKPRIRVHLQGNMSWHSYFILGPRYRNLFICRYFSENYDPLLVRYYYFTKLDNSVRVIFFDLDEVVKRAKADLVDHVANLASRTVVLLNSQFDSKLGSIPPEADRIISEVVILVDRTYQDYLGLRFSRAAANAQAICRLANIYLQQTMPWKTNGLDRERARAHLTLAANCIKILAIVLKPAVPSFSAKMERILGLGDLKWNDTAFNLQNREVNRFERLLDDEPISKLWSFGLESIFNR